MEKVDKIKFINEYDMFEELKDTLERLSPKDTNHVLDNILCEVEKNLKLYPYELYTQYRVEINEEYKDDSEELKKFIGKNLSDTVNKVLWFKETITKDI